MRVFDRLQAIDLGKGAMYTNYLYNVTKSNTNSVIPLRSSKGRKRIDRQWGNRQFCYPNTRQKNGTTSPEAEDPKTTSNG